MKFGVRECCDVVLKAKATQKIGSHTFSKGEPVIYFDTVKTSTVEGAATTVYAQGGKGNPRLLAWEGERTLTFTMEDALISPKGLAILTGADLITAGAGGEVVYAHTTAQVQANEDGELVVNDVISDDYSAYLMLLDSNGEMSGCPMKINGKMEVKTDGTTVINFDSEEEKLGIIKKDLVYFVDYYKAYKSDATQIDITADKFGGYYYLEASTLFKREADGLDLPAEFIIPKCKIQSNFSFTLASSGDPSTFTFTIDAFPDYTIFDKTKKVLCSMQILKADDNYDLASDGDEAGMTDYRRVVYNENTGDHPYNSYLSGKYKGEAELQTDDDLAFVESDSDNFAIPEGWENAINNNGKKKPE